MSPFFSLIVPVYNGGAPFQRCIRAIAQSTFTDWELIVVDDGSVDGSAEIARPIATCILSTAGHEGPAAARNWGALQATGNYLFFIDADCEVHPNTLARAHQILVANPQLDALFGSYDDQPTEPNFASQYKNLCHHFVHQTSDPNATTFWTGCGCVRRERFLDLGGFDAQRYPRPCIEDIEFGYRLIAAGGTIRLAKAVQVKHLKRWTTYSMLRSDIFDRALPWTELLLTRDSAETNLNLRWQNRLSVILIFLTVPLTLYRNSRSRLPFLLLALLGLNWQLYQFFYLKRGLLFTMRAILYHWLYYGYSGVVFGVGFGRKILELFLNSFDNSCE